MKQQHHVTVAVCGGIAAYKSPQFIRDLKAHNYDVQVMMTRAASEFVAPRTLATVSGHAVIQNMWTAVSEDVEHVEDAYRADMLVVFAATAHTIFRLAHGAADDAISLFNLSFAGDRLLCPAMESRMWAHPATQRAIEQLRQDGWVVMEPALGALLSGRSGQGRLPAPSRILAAVETLMAGPLPDLSGRRLLINCGATRELIDPARFISNPSSGRMGVAIANAALLAGAHVRLVAAETTVPLPKEDAHCEIVRIQSAQELYDVMHESTGEWDATICVAAVSDYTPVEISAQKLKKDKTDITQLALKRTPDTLASIAKKPGFGVVVGFAAESNNVVEYAQQKLKRKGCDIIVANQIGGETSAFGDEDNHVHIIDASGEVETVPRSSKNAIARAVIAAIGLKLPTVK